MNRESRHTLDGREFRRIREHLRLSMDEFAIELGYEGNRNTNRNTIKRFETTGEIALVSLLKLAFALDALPEFDALFAPKAVVSITDITQKKRTRGRG